MSDELLNAQNQVKGLSAQLEAIKQMYNESIQSQIQIRSSCVIFQMQIQDYIKEIANLKKEKIDLTSENESLLARCTELDAKVKELGATQDAVNP